MSLTPIKKIGLLASLAFLAQSPVAKATPLLKMQFTSDADGAAPAIAPALTGTTNTKPTRLMVGSGATITVRSSTNADPTHFGTIDAGTDKMFEPGNVVELNCTGTQNPTLRFDSAAADAASSGKVRVDLDMMINSGTLRSGSLFASLKDLSNNAVCAVSVSLNGGQVSLVTYDSSGAYLGDIPLGVAPIGDHLHLQIVLDYTSGTATLTGDNLLYNPIPLAYTRTISGGFAKSRSFGRLDLSLSGSGKVQLDNICINAISNLGTVSVSQYGAVGNGRDDDTGALRLAIADLVNSGTVGTLSLVASSTYVISSTIPIVGAHDFLIEGNGATIKMADNTKPFNLSGSSRVGIWMLDFAQCENFTVQNLTVDGNRSQRTCSIVQAHSIMASDSHYFRFINVKANNSVCDGFYIISGLRTNPETFPSDGLLLNCGADYCYRIGLSIINGNHIAVVGGAYSHTTGTSPGGIADVSTGTFSPGKYDLASGTSPAEGIDIEANGTAGGTGNSYIPSHVGILIRDATFDCNYGASISVAGGGGPRNVTIEDNSFFSFGGTDTQIGCGMTLGSSYSLVQNNFFENFGPAVSYGDASDGIIYLKNYKSDGWSVPNGNNKILNNWFAHISDRDAVIRIALGTNTGIQVTNSVMTDINGVKPVMSGTVNTVVTGTCIAPWPVGYWKLDAFSGTTLPDASGNGNDGAAYNGPVLVPAHKSSFGNALSLSGTNQYVSVYSGTASPLNVQDHFTLALWFMADPASDGTSHIALSKGNDYQFGYSSGDTVGFYSALTGWVYATKSAPKGGWHHAAVTFNGFRVRIYIDGEPAGNSEVKPGGVSVTGQMVMGALAASTSPFQGLIDDVRVYPMVLSLSEIQSVEDGVSAPIP